MFLHSLLTFRTFNFPHDVILKNWPKYLKCRLKFFASDAKGAAKTAAKTASKTSAKTANKGGAETVSGKNRGDLTPKPSDIAIEATIPPLQIES